MVLEAHTASNAGTGVSAAILPTHRDELICTVTGQTCGRGHRFNAGYLYVLLPVIFPN